MVKLKVKDKKFLPEYKTKYAAGADLKAAIDTVVNPGQIAIIPTGVWIDQDSVPNYVFLSLPELQIRLRSSLAAKHGIIIPNGVGTVDLDYPDEIGVILYNSSKKPFPVYIGDRIAQLVLNSVQRFRELAIGGQRVGGFGSTNK